MKVKGNNQRCGWGGERDVDEEKHNRGGEFQQVHCLCRNVITSPLTVQLKHTKNKNRKVQPSPHHYAKWNKPGTKSSTPYELTHARNLKSCSPRHGEAVVIRDVGKQEEKKERGERMLLHYTGGMLAYILVHSNSVVYILKQVGENMMASLHRKQCWLKEINCSVWVPQ